MAAGTAADNMLAHVGGESSHSAPLPSTYLTGDILSNNTTQSAHLREIGQLATATIKIAEHTSTPNVETQVYTFEGLKTYSAGIDLLPGGDRIYIQASYPANEKRTNQNTQVEADLVDNGGNPIDSVDVGYDGEFTHQVAESGTTLVNDVTGYDKGEIEVGDGPTYEDLIDQKSLARVSFNEISSAVTVGKIELGNPKKWNWKTLAASDFVIAAATGEIDTVIYDVPARK